MLTQDLQYSIEFQRETESLNEAGVPSTAWTTCLVTYASKFVRTGRLVDGEHSTYPSNITEWRIRYNEDIDYGFRIKFKSQYYRITFIEELGRENVLRIETELAKFNDF